MKYRVVEDLEAEPEERFRVQHSPFGHTWTDDAAFGDQVSAEIAMERLAAPRVVCSLNGASDHG